VRLRSPVGILALLTGLNLLNYLDRFVLAAVLEPVKGELTLSDTMAGALATVFLIGYFVTSPIFARLAETVSRRTLIAIGIVIWSLATIGSGLVHDEWSLIGMRILVGVGEASYAVLAPTIIDDLAPPEKKGRWLAIFYVATPVGSALGYMFGGAIGEHYGWRAAFHLAGGPGILLAIICLFMVEPPYKLAEKKESIAETVSALAKFPRYVTSVLGYCAYNFAVGGFAFWAPSFLIRTYKMSLNDANYWFGAVTVAGGIVGTVLGGRMADRGTARLGGGDESTVRSALRVCAIGSLFGAPLAVAAFLAPSWTAFFGVVFFCEVGMFLNSAPINAAIMRSVPEHRRASAMAMSIAAIHLFGDLWSPTLIGVAADRINLRWAVMLVPIAILASGLLWLSRRGDRVERAAA
jgi:MFS family permease